MAFTRELVIMTFDEGDTYNEKMFLLKMFQDRGYILISEVKINETSVVKEWILQGPSKIGKIGPLPQIQGTKEGRAKADVFNFRPDIEEQER